MANQIKLNEEQLRNMIMQAINEEMDELNGYFPNLVKRGLDKAINKGKELYNNYQADKQAFNATTAKEKDAMVQAKKKMKQGRTDMRAAKKISSNVLANADRDLNYLEVLRSRYGSFDKNFNTIIGNVRRVIENAKKWAPSRYTKAAENSENLKGEYNTSKTTYRDARRDATNTYGMPQPQQQAVNEAIDIAVDRILNEIKKH